MADFLGMGGYAAYVWTAYVVFAIVILFDAVMPLLQRQRALNQLRGRLRREAAKKPS
jgi:heme exporter protein D